ncbi:hypothetical protein AGMMS50239_03130 [Bacteroidia bacterium]|nr:hypothetical protein AGMMS50239_03130 [Bacteroidia bacterium]
MKNLSKITKMFISYRYCLLLFCCSITLTSCNWLSDLFGDEPDKPFIFQEQERIYLGVVAFNDTISISPISKDLQQSATFINNKQNDVDATSLCYAVSKGITLFNQQSLPIFDKIFIVSFTDGQDNVSSLLYKSDGKLIPQANVYNQAHNDLISKTGLISYAIGFDGKEIINETDMRKLVVSPGTYETANNTTIETVFKKIANSVLASSKNFTLITQNGIYTAEYPKYFRITVKAKPNKDESTVYSDEIFGKLVGTTFTVTDWGNHSVSFNDNQPVTGIVQNKKMELPFNKLKFTKQNGNSNDNYECFIQEIIVEVSYSGNDYHIDTEDSSVSGDISKKIGIVLVLDCSTSLGNAFGNVKNSAVEFIKVLSQTGK